jgi:hypothetical protein
MADRVDFVASLTALVYWAVVIGVLGAAFTFLARNHYGL